LGGGWAATSLAVTLQRQEARGAPPTAPLWPPAGRGTCCLVLLRPPRGADAEFRKLPALLNWIRPEPGKQGCCPRPRKPLVTNPKMAALVEPLLKKPFSLLLVVESVSAGLLTPSSSRCSLGKVSSLLSGISTGDDTI